MERPTPARYTTTTPRAETEPGTIADCGLRSERRNGSTASPLRSPPASRGRSRERGDKFYVTGIPNLYQFVEGNPVRRLDRYGDTWSTFWTAGEECAFTGEYRIITDDDTIPISDSGWDYIFGGAWVTETFYYCQCKIHCCDYDWKPATAGLDFIESIPPFRFFAMIGKGEWVLDSEWDDWADEGDRHREYKTYEDASNMAAKAGEAIGAYVKMTTNPGRDEGTGSRLSDDLADVVGKIGAIMAENQFNQSYPQEAWEGQKQARVETYTRACESACKAKKGQNY